MSASSVDLSLNDSIPPQSLPAAADSSPWDEMETLQMTLPIPEAPPASLPSTRPESLPTMGHIGRYALKYRIGEGGLGTVFAAHDPLLSRLIAVKTLNVDLPDDQRSAFNAMFLNEAKAAGSLSHPNIVTVFDAGVHEDGENQSAYIAMELLKGKDLRQLMKEGWKPTHAQAGLIVRRVADALAFAHSKGVIHCDIKPANIFMVGRTQPRVLDFGIARIAKRRDAAPRDGDTLQHDDAELMAGSPFYMAPEQVKPQNFERRAQNLDRRADVYSLGVVFYELLTGHRPFEGETLSAISDAVLTRKAPTAHQVDSSIPRELSDIAERAMMRNRDHRTHSARAMSRELRAWLETQSPSAFEARPLTEPKKRRAVWIAAVSVAIGVSATVMWWGLTQSSSPPNAAAQVVQQPEVSPQPLATALQPASGPVVEADNAASAAEPLISAYEVDPAASSGIVAVHPVEPDPAEPPSPAPTLRTNRPTAKARSATAAPVGSARQAPQSARRHAATEQPAAVLESGILGLAVSPWAQVEIDGKPVGTTPPLKQLNLTEGKHTITLQNDATIYTTTVMVTGGQTVVLKHRF